VRSHTGQKACDDDGAISDRMLACRHVSEDCFQFFGLKSFGLFHFPRSKNVMLCALAAYFLTLVLGNRKWVREKSLRYIDEKTVLAIGRCDRADLENVTALSLPR
jgi:hypothetical protein